MPAQDGRCLSREALETFRLRAIELRYTKNYSVKQIAEVFGIHYNSVSRWFCKERTGGVAALRRTYAEGASPKLNIDLLKWLSTLLTHPATDFHFDVPLWNCSMIQKLLHREKEVTLDPSTIWRYLRKLGLSYQKPEKRYFQQHKETVDKWIQEAWPAIRKWVKTHQAILYFEDESGIALAPVIGKTWALKGKTPIIRVTGKRGGVTAMSAISPSGKFRFRLEKRRINAQVMKEFLGQVLATHPRRHIAVVMDQAPAHRAKKLKHYVATLPRLAVYYLPPYSPELNPDEKVWRHLKHVELKNHQAQDKQQLIRVTLAALRRMQKKSKMTKAFFKGYLT